MSVNPRDYFVYFILGAENRVKIGTAKSPYHRLEELQPGSSVQLKMLGAMQGGVLKERELHKKFHHIRKFGEWFELTEELELFIAENTVEISKPQRHTPASGFIIGRDGRKYSAAKVCGRGRFGEEVSQ